jgi:PadR family transcriptional regulator, regulatory protein PadR
MLPTLCHFHGPFFYICSSKEKNESPPYLSVIEWFDLPLTLVRRSCKPIAGRRGEQLMPPSTDLLQGTLDLLILRTLALEPMHGWGIAQRIQLISNEVLQIGQGSLYPALHRLEYKGWIESDWGASDNNRRAKFYSLTSTGKKQLKAELATWERLSTAVASILNQLPETSI